MKEVKLLVRDLVQAGIKFAVAYPFFLVIVLLLTPIAKMTWYLIVKAWNLF